MKSIFPNFRRSKDYFSFNYVQTSPRIANKLATFEVGHANVKIGDTVYPLQMLNEKQIGKQLTNIDVGGKVGFGRIVRNRIKAAIDELTPVQTTVINGKEVYSYYAAVIIVAGVIKIALSDFHRVDDSHVAGTFFIIHAKEDINGDHDYATYKHVLNFDEDKEKYYVGKNIKPFMPTLKTKSFTEPVNTMIKIEKRGGARKVEAVITVNSTLEENNAATVEIKEKYNEVVEIVNDQQAEFEAMKAKLAEFETMKAELAQLKAAMNPTQELIKTMQPRTGSIFARPVATAKQEAMLDLEAIKAVPFTFDSTEIERL
ncbi:hypothetical protein HXV88_08495 [Aeromonas veronii]|uniref:hypothetical protein n=1 Tax=Aeromonas veronii TaxID=654 RepID=UPI0015D0A80F|nr:hypothetical protein [Aeromonas veronii]QLH66490.1 hypothetical protein HXV88_08495 [Aeromonas veronii]